MSIQFCFSGLKPSPPTIRSRIVAERVAARLVAEVNVDDLYWEPEEIPTRLADVTREIMRYGRPETVFSRLYKQQHPIDDTGRRGGHPYGWEGIDEYCRAIAKGIADEETAKAVGRHKREFGQRRQRKADK